jgi:ClpP class serine protease
VLDTFSPEKASDVTLIKNLQKEIHDIFISVVKERRGEKLNGTDKELFNGLFWTGGRAKELGLIDGIGTVRDVLEEKFGEDVKLDYITTPKSWLKSKLGVSLGFTSTNLAEQALGVAQERLWWERLGL